MAATSLAEQLKKLAVPQSSIYKDVKKKASLLFDPREAALKDRDTFYEIGVSGLNELIALYEGFRFFEDTLFNLSSKDFERAVQSKDVNQNLDTTIEKFLLQLAPYLLLQSSHKALEWLVNRYHIHQYNQDAIMTLILPYHETKIFVRFIQIMDIKENSNRWNWLQGIRKPGVPLAKQVLQNQCNSNPATLQFIAKSILKYVKEFGDRSSQLNTIFAFFCSTTIGTIDTANRVTEALINAILPTLMKALESPVTDFRSSAYVILGFLSSKANIKESTVNDIIQRIINSEFGLTYDMVLLINLIYTTQTEIQSVGDEIMNISADTMMNFAEHLKKMVAQNINAMPFILKFLSSVLTAVQSDSEDFRRFSKLPEILIEEIDLKSQRPEKVIKCFLDSYGPLKTETKENDESDIEIIEEGDFNTTILDWYSSMLKKLEQKYPTEFDKVIMKKMNSKSGISTSTRNKLSKLLGFKPAVSHKVGGTSLFEHLNHVNPTFRVEAVNYISRNFKVLQSENADFLKDSIINRFADEDPDVVSAMLDIPTNYLNSVLSNTDLTSIFVKVIARDLRNYKKWKPVVNSAIGKFCSLNSLPVSQETVLAVMPHLFPYNEESALVAWNIISSPWGKKFTLTNSLKGLSNVSAQTNHKLLSQTVFKALCVNQQHKYDDMLDFTRLDKTNVLDVCFYLLLKTQSLKKAPVEEISNLLDLLFQAVEKCSIESSSEDHVLTSSNISEFVMFARQDKIMFEFMLYIFTRIIEDVPTSDITKPWCNVCMSSETILIRRLYETCIIGCFIPTYSSKYGELMQNLLGKICSNTQEKFEFMANFACGHILFASEQKDVINPELQLRSLKLMHSYISAQKELKWAYESDVIILMLLFNLNNPLSVIRQISVDIIESILNTKVTGTHTYIQLLKQLLEHKEELLLDHEQLLPVLSNILTQAEPSKKTFKKNCLLKIMGPLIDDTPAHIKSEILNILGNINNTNILSHILPSLSSIIKTLKENTDSNFTFSVYETKFIRNVVNRITPSTISVLDDDDSWSLIEALMQEFRECLTVSPSVLIMGQIDENSFKKLPDKRAIEMVKLICNAGTNSNNPDICSVASKTMKKVHLNFAHFQPILDAMFDVKDPAENPKRRNSVSMLTYQLAETQEWRQGITLLEYVQSKKKLSVDNKFVSTLFKILTKCLRFEEQSYVEYTKQLILSSLWYYCKKFVDESDKDQVQSLKTVFDIETVVQCIRNTQNPQTHHHALILLSHAAYMLPEQVLHHTMEIFTFMGTSVLRHDDAYSFQIIIKIIETLIPILVKMDRDIDEYSAKELEQLQKRVVPVLRIFADVVLHVPEHRRLPLYKKLLETLGPNHFLWVFSALLLETHVRHFNESKEKENRPIKTLADQESPVNRTDFGQSILLEFPPEVCLQNFIHLMTYVKSLPLQKDESNKDTTVKSHEIFSVNGHSALQLRHYKYVIITFMNTCLSSSRFVQHIGQATDEAAMETHFKSLIINVLTFIQSISKISDEKTAKYWRVMLHHSYDLLDHANNLLSVNMFLSVIRGLLNHTLHVVRRKAMELLNSKIQFSPEFFNDCDKELLFSLLPALLNIVKTIDSNEESNSDVASQELELNQQTALLCLKLLTRMLASENREAFIPVLEKITEYTCNPNISGNVMASIVLCLAELCGNLKAHALASLRKFMPALIKVLKKQRQSETPELLLLSTVTAVAKIVENLPLFLSPYLQKILQEYAVLLAKWQSMDQECPKVAAMVSKLSNIKKKIATCIPPRVLIPVVNQTHRTLLEKEDFDAIGSVMSVLAESFTNVTTADFTALQQDITTFFLSALQLRSDVVEKDVDNDVIDRAEDEVVNALVCLVLKLSESSFRPFYFKIYDWAIRTNVEGQKDRAITFYRLSSAIAEKLKGLFVLFAGHFIKNAAELLDSCNKSKSENLYFDSDEKCLLLVNSILKTLQVVFLYDSQNFLNKERFETIMQPVVDQLENTVGGISGLRTRASELLIPCISQFAVATADDSLWKLMYYQILLKTRHNDAEIRLTALDTMIAMATQLGSGWLPLLAESVPFLAELLEDGDPKIESCTKDAIRKLEQILDEPLEKYF